MSGRVRKLALTMGTLLAVLGIGAGVAAAATRDPVVSGVTNHTVYQFGNSVTVNGTVNGDVICAGQNVNIDATVNGDVICAGQSVTVNGTVNGNIRVAGQTINIGAGTDRNVSVAGQSITLQSGARVGRDAGIAAQSATFNGQVGRDLNAAAQSLTLNDSIGRNVDATVNKLNLQSGAKIGGNLSYTSHNKLSQSGGATIAGTVSYHQPQTKANKGHGSFWGFWLLRALYFSITLLIFSLILVAIFPQAFAAWNDRLRVRPWLALLIGFLAMFVVPAIIVALFITVIGAPLALLLMLSWIIIFFLLSAPVAAYYIGSLILRNGHPLLRVLVGGLILGLLNFVPVLGVIVTLLAVWLGSGGILLNLRHSYRSPNYRTETT